MKEKELIENLFTKHSEAGKKALRPIMREALEEVGEANKYYTPEPGEDPHLPPGTPCEVRDHLEENWIKGKYGFCSGNYEYPYVIGRVGWNLIRFRLSDIQDRGDEMVWKMVMAWDDNGKGPACGYCEKACNEGYTVFSDLRPNGRSVYEHARYYTHGWGE